MINYTPKFKINEQVYFQDKKYFIRGAIAKASSHPDPEIEYFLSEKENHPCTTNVSDKENINENMLWTLKDYKDKKIKEAKDFLISEGVSL